MVAPITAQTWPIGAFLATQKASIPDLQRPYAWDQQQAEDLVNDLRIITEQILSSSPENNAVSQHFFGTIVLLKPVAEFKPIIDGQQRLTTITSLLSVVEHAFKQVAEEAKYVGAPGQVATNCIQLADEIHGKLWVAGPMDPQGRLVYVPRLKVSQEISQIYQDALDGKVLVKHPNQPEAVNKLRDNITFFDTKFVRDERFFRGEPVNKFRYLHAIYRAISDGLIVVSLETEAADKGYDLFESLNARGLELNVLDLLKVWMLARLSERDCPEHFMAKAALPLANFAGGNVKFQARLFDYYFRARAQVNTDTYSQKGLAIEARRRIFKDPSLQSQQDALSIYERIMSEISRLDTWSPIAADLESASDPAPRCIQFSTGADRLWTSRRILHLKKTMGHKGALIPLLMIAGDKLRNDPNRFTDLVHTLERFFFRYRKVCSGPEKKIEEAYYRFIQVIEANGTIELDFVRETLNALLRKHADDQRFADLIAEKMVYQKSALVKYALHTIHLYGLPPTPKRDPADLSGWWIEHIAPQNPNGVSVVSPELIHSLGNLCLLNPEINQELSNLSFDAKKIKVEELRRRNINIDAHDTLLVFSDGQKTWTDDDVLKRQDRLIKRLVQIYTL